jgi:ABC-type branched-subunit amino acid transport system substrate-binding protein
MGAGVALGLGMALVGAGCSSPGTTAPSTSNTTTTASTGTNAPSPSNVPGVTSTQVDVGAISSRTGPLAGYFGGLSPGMTAYFDTINAHGGVNGRKIVLTNSLDDGGSPSQFTQDVHNLIDGDHVFAIGVASAWFTPNYFVATKTPTYGYNVSANWQTAPNLFAVGGSTQIYSSAFSTLSWAIRRLQSKSVAFISYGPAIASSYDACSAYAQGMRNAGYQVFSDVGAQLGGTYASDVQRIQQSGATMLVSCMQASDNITMARDIRQYGLNIKQLWLNGYDQALLDQYSSLMQGVYLDITGVVPFVAADTTKFGSLYPGMQQYVAAMKKYEPAYVYNGVAFDGWQSAALLAAGIKAAGRNLTQAGVVDATNTFTNFTAGGLSAPVNWKVVHVGYTVPNCSAYVQVRGRTFESALATGKQVFVCVNANVKNPAVVPPPAGTPGT